MRKFNVVEAWLDNVAFAHSRSKATEESYRLGLRSFCEFLECSPQQILDEYEKMSDRQFRRRYAQFLRGYISRLSKRDYTVSTIQVKVTPVKSFFKYNDLPLGYVPVAKKKVTYHNRDITKREIIAVLSISSVRERAFDTMMAQSGLRPHTLCLLRRKHVEPDFTKGIVPCMIEVPEELAKGQFGAYFSFMGEESVKYLRVYFNKRGIVGPEDYIFTKTGLESQLNRKSVGNLFKTALEKLKAAGTIDFKQIKPGKHRELRLYCLRSWFRKQAGKAGIEYVNFWMGHKTNYKAPHIPASDVHYFSREDVEFQRQLYKEKAMPFLRLETATPSETEQTIMGLRKQLTDRDREVAELRQEIESLSGVKRLADVLERSKSLEEAFVRFKRLKDREFE